MPPVVRGQGCLKGSDCWCRRLFQSQPWRWWGQECAPPTFPSNIPALRLPARPPVRGGSPAELIHLFSGSVCADRGQGPQRKRRKGSGEWMDRWNCPSSPSEIEARRLRRTDETHRRLRTWTSVCSYYFSWILDSWTYIIILTCSLPLRTFRNLFGFTLISLVNIQN